MSDIFDYETDALCVKHGAYVFKVDKETYDLF